jgi:hypothetical protein
MSREGSVAGSVSSLFSAGGTFKYSKHRDDPTDFLGLDNDQFNAYMEQLAMTSPGAYLAIRHRVYKLLIKGVIKYMDDLIHDSLTEGRFDGEQVLTGEFMAAFDKHPGVQQIFNEMRKTFGDDGFKPRIPRQEANQITMGVCAGLKDVIMEKVVDKILNRNRVSHALGSAQKQAELNLGGAMLS